MIEGGKWFSGILYYDDDVDVYYFLAFLDVNALSRESSNPYWRTQWIETGRLYRDANSSCAINASCCACCDGPFNLSRPISPTMAWGCCANFYSSCAKSVYKRSEVSACTVHNLSSAFAHVRSLFPTMFVTNY